MSHLKNPILGLILALLMGLPATALAADTYKVDPVHSTVIFKTKHFDVGYVYGRFRKVSGTIVVDEKKPARSKVNLELDASSVFTADKKRDTHIKSPDFLNVKQFPKITFTSTKVKKRGKSADVTGKLTLHGKTRTITVRMNQVGSGKDPYGNFRIGFEGTFTINRSDFGITKMKGVAGEKMHLIIAVEGIRK